jgi:tetratricopeptide (TPR) repeat protein
MTPFTNWMCIARDNLQSAKNGYKILTMAAIRYQSAIARLKPAAFWTLALALSTWPVRAQKGTPPSGGSGGSRGAPGGGAPVRTAPPPLEPGTEPNSEPGVFFPTTQPIPKPVMTEDEACLPWALADVRGATVSAARLAVPAKARSQYEKACGSYKKKKFTEAEQHARDAIEQYSNYSAAWVMLGQVLEGEQKMQEAHDACSKPMSVDPSYLPPYLCLAGLLDRQKQWSDLLALSDRFRGVNSSGDLYAYYYRGLALFQLRNFPDAQKSVLQAIAIDTEHHQPGLNFLLAQIYGEQGDLVDAKLQIQQFQKFSNSKQDKDSAKEYLSELQSRLNAK